MSVLLQRLTFDCMLSPDMALKAMEEGEYFIKVRSKSWRKTRHIRLSQDRLSLVVTKKSFFPSKPKIRMYGFVVEGISGRKYDLMLSF